MNRKPIRRECLIAHKTKIDKERTNQVMTKPLKCNLAAAIICWAALAVAPQAPAQTPPGLNLQLYAGLSITGAVGTVYSVEYATDLTQTNSWRCLEFLQLPVNPYLWV